MYLYHYTDCRGLSKINGERSLKSHFTHRGKGVFFTTKNPKECSKKDIATACFAGGAEKRLGDGKVDYYIEIVVDDTNSHQFSRERDDVYKCRDSLELDLFSWRSGQVSSWSPAALVAGGTGIALLGGLLFKGAEYYIRYTNTKREKEEKLHQMVERRLLNILSNFHHSRGYSNPQNRFTLLKTVDESKGYGIFGSPKGHTIFISCSMCQSCISSAFPLEEGTLGLINENRIRSEMESHVYSCLG
mmetsp:Transcript_23638/g.35037  ORF Transcript_23638/g.35037 Transcript_23638/m.35037 type:complete len:245 (-) Transcript_23638:110-844(-)